MKQSQKSLTDQLNELISLGTKNGLYDAVDWVVETQQSRNISKINLHNIKSETSDEIYSHPNPYMENGKWYWYDETESLSDPYETEEEARKALDRYVSTNLNFEGEI